MGLISRWLNRRIVATQKNEMQSFVDGLSSMDAPEVAFVLAIATHMRTHLEESKIRVMDPIVGYVENPTAVLKLQKMIRLYQKQGQNTDASGMMVWLHTMRVGGQHELRPVAREMWRQLERGMPYVQQAAAQIYALTTRWPEIDGHDQFPAGLTPEPL